MSGGIEKDPFRIFFPLGAALALSGVLPWASQFFGHAGYPRDLHRMLMINGFLLSFVAGFLMTAVPRFTSSEHASMYETAVIFVSLVLAAAGAFGGSQALNFLFSGCAIMALMYFGIRRFKKRKSNPPYTFIFIGIGLVLWLLTNIGQFLAALGVSVPAQFVLDDLFSNGAIMAIILGVGGRLIPGILGWQEIVSTQRAQYESPKSFVSVIPLDVWVCVLVFIASFFLEPVLPLQLCFLIRAIVTLYFGVRYWSILKIPRTKSFLTFSIWPCCWCLALGYFLPAIWIGASVHALHLLFIGGFSLLTLLISTRVIFAHSGAGTEIEKTTRSISVFTALILFAMVTRVTAILWPQIYLDHLGYAALVWVLALFTWLWIVLPKLTVSN